MSVGWISEISKALKVQKFEKYYSQQHLMAKNDARWIKKIIWDGKESVTIKLVGAEKLCDRIVDWNYDYTHPIISTFANYQLNNYLIVFQKSFIQYLDWRRFFTQANYNENSKVGCHGVMVQIT